MIGQHIISVLPGALRSRANERTPAFVVPRLVRRAMRVLVSMIGCENDRGEKENRDDRRGQGTENVPYGTEPQNANDVIRTHK